MARLFYIIFTIFLSACGLSVPHVEKASESTPVYTVQAPLDMERNNYRASYIIPGQYNIELIDVDTLHPVMKISYSARRPSGDGYEWVNAVLKLDISAEQRSQLRSLLYHDLLPRP